MTDIRVQKLRKFEGRMKKHNFLKYFLGHKSVTLFSVEKFNVPNLFFLQTGLLFVGKGGVRDLRETSFNLDLFYLDF